MRSSPCVVLALAGVATAFTPPGFQPASTNNLTVAFGNTLAINGVNLPKAGQSTLPSSQLQLTTPRNPNSTHNRNIAAISRKLHTDDG